MQPWAWYILTHESMTAESTKVIHRMMTLISEEFWGSIAVAFGFFWPFSRYPRFSDTSIKHLAPRMKARHDSACFTGPVLMATYGVQRFRASGYNVSKSVS